MTDLKTVIQGDHWSVAAVDGVSFTIGRGEIVGIVGESGSGKTLTAMSLLRLVSPPVVIQGGSAIFEGRDLLKLSTAEMRKIRAAKISMIFQDPLTSLDEAFTIGHQLIETIRAHESLSASAAEKLAVETMERVGIASAKRRLKAYPHEFSGGMRQRVMIAMALVLKPRLVIADEPTTAVDVTTQAQILELIRDLQHEIGTSVLLISHDLSIVLDVADRVMVMYAGQIVESATNHSLYHRPLHPYTQGLLRSKLSMIKEIEYVTVMPGQIPALRERSMACRFAPRCPHALEKCVKTAPSLAAAADGAALLRCYNPQPWSPP